MALLKEKKKKEFGTPVLVSNCRICSLSKFLVPLRVSSALPRVAFYEQHLMVFFII